VRKCSAVSEKFQFSQRLLFVCLRFAVACSLGTWYNLASGTCEFCPAGTYQDMEGQLSCKPCPHKLYGVGIEDAKSIAECGGRLQSVLQSFGKVQY